MKDKKILCVILARGGSKGIPGKNIKDLAGHPLIAYTICEAVKSNHIDRVIVSSDDDDIRNVARKYGAEAPFTRPEELSTDTAKPVDCIKHATEWVEKDGNMKYDYVVELLCTNPFKTSNDIDEALEMQIETDADSVIAASKNEIRLIASKVRYGESSEITLHDNGDIWTIYDNWSIPHTRELDETKELPF